MQTNYLSPSKNRQIQLSNNTAQMQGKKCLNESTINKYLNQNLRLMAMMLVLLGSINVLGQITVPSNPMSIVNNALNTWTLPKMQVNLKCGASITNLPTKTGGSTNLGGQGGSSGAIENYHGEQSNYAHNVQLDNNGNILFFIVDGKVYDSEGYSIGIMRIEAGDVGELNTNGPEGSIVTGQNEFEIIPVPGDMTKKIFYIVGTARAIGTDAPAIFFKPFYCKIDMNLNNIYFNDANRRGLLINANNNQPNNLLINGMVCHNLGLFDNYSPYSGGGYRLHTEFASSKMNASSIKSFLFATNGETLEVLKVTSSNITVIPSAQTIVQNIGLQFTNNTTGFSSSVSGLRTEMEVIEKDCNYKIALSVSKFNTYGDYNSSLYHCGICIIGFNSSSELFDLNDPIIGVSNSQDNLSAYEYIKGMEFSPNGNFLYVTTTFDAVNKRVVKFLDLNSYIPNSHNYTIFKNVRDYVPNLSIANDNLYEFSSIELGPDDKLYLIKNDKLGVISNPNTPYSSLGWTEINLPNGFTYNLSTGGMTNGEINYLYTLPDQIDGRVNTAMSAGLDLDYCTCNPTATVVKCTTAVAGTNYNWYSYPTRIAPYSNLDTIQVKPIATYNYPFTTYIVTTTVNGVCGVDEVVVTPKNCCQIATKTDFGDPTKLNPKPCPIPNYTFITQWTNIANITGSGVNQLATINATSGSVYAAALSAGQPLPTAPITLSGNLMINVNTVIDAATIDIGSQNYIRVLYPCTLTIKNNAHLQACPQMCRWKGLIVDKGAKIIINTGGTIEDADFAVDIDANANMILPLGYTLPSGYSVLPNNVFPYTSNNTTIYNFNGAKFYRNYYHARISNFPELNGNSNCKIVASSFTCSSPLAKTMNTGIGNGSTSNPTPQYTKRGVQINGSKDLAVGNVLNAANLFDNAEAEVEVITTDNILFNSNNFNNSGFAAVGIRSQASSINVMNNNTFTQLDKGIYAYGISSIKNIKVFSTNSTANNYASYSNVFNKCNIGIFGDVKTNLQVRFAKFLLCGDRGVYGKDGWGINQTIGTTTTPAYNLNYPNNYYILNNYFDDCLNSIETNNVLNANLEIAENKIIHTQQGSSTFLNMGILCNTVVNNTSNILQKINIHHNQISKAYRGIKLMGGGNHLPNNSANNLFNAMINNNQVFVRRCVNPTSTYPITIGIEVSSCRQAQIALNTVNSDFTDNDIAQYPSYATEGIRADNCPSAFVSCNQTLNIGDQFLFGGTSSPVTTQNNNMILGFRGMVLGADIGEQPINGAAQNKVQDNRWSAFQSGTFKVQNYCVPIGIATKFHYRNSGPYIINDNSDFTFQNCPGNSGSLPTAHSNIINSPTNTTVNCNYPPALTSSMQEMAAQIINEYPELFGSYSTEEIEKLYLSGYDFYKLLKDNPAFMNSNPDYVTYKQDMDQTDMKLIAELERLAQWPMDSIIQDSAKALKSAINPNREAEVNYKKYYEAMLEVKEFKENTQLSNGAIELLRELAVECPYTGGNAVYSARSVLRKFGDPLADFINDCELYIPEGANSSARIAHQPNSQTIVLNEGMLAPINVQVNTSTELFENYMLINALGQNLGTYKFKQGTNTFDLQSNHLNTGIYYLHNQVNKNTIKLVVQP